MTENLPTYKSLKKITLYLETKNHASGVFCRLKDIAPNRSDNQFVSVLQSIGKSTKIRPYLAQQGTFVNFKKEKFSSKRELRSFNFFLLHLLTSTKAFYDGSLTNVYKYPNILQDQKSMFQLKKEPHSFEKVQQVLLREKYANDDYEKFYEKEFNLIYFYFEAISCLEKIHNYYIHHKDDNYIDSNLIDKLNEYFSLIETKCSTLVNKMYNPPIPDTKYLIVNDDELKEILLISLKGLKKKHFNDMRDGIILWWRPFLKEKLKKQLLDNINNSAIGYNGVSDFYKQAQQKAKNKKTLTSYSPFVKEEIEVLLDSYRILGDFILPISAKKYSNEKEQIFKSIERINNLYSLTFS